MKQKIQLYDTDYVRVVNNELADDLDTIYSKESLDEMLLDMKENNISLQTNEKYVKMTSLTIEQQQKYIDYLSNQLNN
jgi:nitrous oxidase accessory protein NosD